MSQVKKLAKGGTFIIDGQELTGTDAINAVRPYLGETTGGIMNALQEGATVNYNSGNNTISIVDSNGKDRVYDYLPASRGASTMDSRLKKDIGATLHTKNDQFKRELRDVGRAFDTHISDHPEKAIDLKALARGSGYFYTKDKDGKSIYLEGPENNNRLETIKAIRAYLEGDDDFRKGYKTEGWKQADLDALKNWVNNPAVSTDRDAYWKGLFDRIRGNNLSDIDKQTLNLMGFSEESTPIQESTVRDGYDANGNPIIGNGWTGDVDASKKAGIGWRKDKDGRWEIIADPNNQFLTQNWWTAGLDFLPEEYQNRGFLLNGKLYREDEVYNNKSLAPYVSGWYGNKGKNWKDWYDLANTSGLRFVNDRIWDNQGNDYYGVYSQQFNPIEEYNEFLTPYFRNNNITGITNVADVTDQFENLANGSRVFSYLDPTNAFNNRGVPTQTYVYYNPANKENPYSTDLSGLTRSLYGGSGHFDTVNWVQGNRGRRYALYRNIGVPGVENSILTDDNGNYYLGKWNQSAKKLIGNEIYNIDLLNEILADPNNPKWNNPELEKLLIATATSPKTPIKNVMQANIRLRKEGGELPKLQFGGPIKNTNTTKTQKRTEDAKTDIVKPHKLDKSDGDLTSWEKMQIGAAIGDALGVGMSFAGPVGGIAGTVTGLGSTATRFAADVKKDGLDWGDVKRGVVNIGFDLAALPASLIPGADNFIRASKLARTVRSIGQPVLKWLGTIGATTSTVNIAKKWINGESPTSQDLSAFISGLGAGAVAGKQWSKQLGASRLAGKQSKIVADATNANIPKEVSATIGENKQLKYSTEGLSKIITDAKGDQSKVLEKIIADAKNQGVELTAETAKPILEKLGVQTDIKGKLNFWIRKDGKWKLPLTRGNQRVEYTPQQKQTAHGATYYFTHPIARQRALGYMEPRNQNNLLNSMTPEQYNSIIKESSLRDHTIGGALRRVALDNPKSFNFKFAENPSLKVIPWQFGRRGFVRNTPYQSQAEPIRVNYGNVQLPVLYKPQSEILTPEVVVPQGSFFTRRLELPQGFIPRGLLGQRNSQINPLYGPGIIKYQAPRKQTNGFVVYGPTNTSFTFKKGGKIVKAQLGTLIKYTDPEWVNPFDKTSSTSITSKSSMDGTTGSLTKTFSGLNFEPIDSNRFIYDPNYRLNLNPINKPLPQQNLNLPSFRNTIREPLLSDVSPMAKYTVHTALKNAQKDALSNITNTDAISNAKIERPGGNPGKEWGINQANIADYIDTFGRVRRGINQDRDIQRRALGELYKRQFLTPEIDRAKYNFSDIEQGYNQATSPYLEQKFVTSDARDSMAFKLNKAQQLSQLAGQKNAQITQRQLQTDDINRQIDTQNENSRVQTANTVSQYLTNLNYQDNMLDSVRLNRWNAEGIGRLSQQMRQQLRDSQNKIAMSRYARDYSDLQTSEAQRFNLNLRNLYWDDWAKLSNEQKNSYGDFQSYAYARDPQKYEELRQPLASSEIKMNDITDAVARAMGAGFFYKSGGTINIRNTNKNQRSAQEQIAINGDKAAKRSVDELSRALLKMLQQLQAIK